MADEPAPTPSQEKWTTSPEDNSRDLERPSTTDADHNLNGSAGATNGGGEARSSAPIDTHSDNRMDSVLSTGSGGGNKPGSSYRERQVKVLSFFRLTL